MNSSSAALVLIVAMAAGTAHAGSRCELSLRPITSGFVLNPKIDTLTVVEARSLDPERPCTLLADDELLQINDQIIPGSRAKALMKYWEDLPRDAGFNFKVRREGSTISVLMD